MNLPDVFLNLPQGHICMQDEFRFKMQFPQRYMCTSCYFDDKRLQNAISELTAMWISCFILSLYCKRCHAAFCRLVDHITVLCNRVL